MKRAAYTGLLLWSAAAWVPAGTPALPDRLGAQPAFVALAKQDEYTAASLYEYIDGGADVYLEAGATHCVVRNYGQDPPGDREFEVAIYELAGDLQAFGLFRQLQTGRDRKLGVESAESPRRVAFWKTRYYAEVLDKSSKPAGAATMLALGAAVAALVPAAGALPPALAQLPDSQKVAGSERYWKSGFLSRGFLDNVVSAVYRAPAAACTLFVMTCPSDSAAAGALRKLAGEFGAAGRVRAVVSGSLIDGCAGCAQDEWKILAPLLNQRTAAHGNAGK